MRAAEFYVTDDWETSRLLIAIIPFTRSHSGAAVTHL
jgi:hypothetical protein